MWSLMKESMRVSWAIYWEGFLGFNWAIAFTIQKTIGGKRLFLLDE